MNYFFPSNFLFNKISQSKIYSQIRFLEIHFIKNDWEIAGSVRIQKNKFGWNKCQLFENCQTPNKCHFCDFGISVGCMVQQSCWCLLPPALFFLHLHYWQFVLNTTIYVYLKNNYTEYAASNLPAYDNTVFIMIR